MMNIKRILLVLVIPAVFLVTGCIKNDIPYARIQANIIEIEAVGQSAGARIDTLTRTVNFYFPEEVDISRVEIASWRVADDVTVVGDSLDMILDMTTPATVTLRLYQDYTWTLIANQTIERYFTVEGQIGTTTIDIPGHRVVVLVPETADLSDLTVTSCKLGPSGWPMTPNLEGREINFSQPVRVTVDYYGTPQEWTIYVEPTELVVSTTRVDAWTNVAWVYGDGKAGSSFGVQYRIAGETEWTTAPADWMTVDGGSFTVCLRHLMPLTDYEARVFADEDMGNILTFTTGSNIQLPNEDFDQWWQNGKIWEPWPEGGVPFWDTGNDGAATLGSSNVFPTDDTSTGSGYAAQLETRFVGFGSLGKLAAGSIFAGTFVDTDGTNGILSFGREFTQRPTKVRGYLKYRPYPINHASEGFEDLIGQTDTCIVWVALIDAAEPVEIRTRPTNRKLFDKNAPDVIAYGEYQTAQTISSYIPIEFTLDYRNTGRVPRYILFTCSSSKYGDYFTGGSAQEPNKAGSIMWLDNFELLYDY